MMRVLHIFNSLMPSGAETMLTSARAALADVGVSVDVVATDAEIGPYAKSMASAGYGVLHVPHRRRRVVDFGYAIALYRLIRRGKYDAVQVHPEAWRLTNCVVARLAGVHNVVTTVHNVFSPSGLRFYRRKTIMWFIERLGVRIVAIGDSVLENELRFGAHPKMIYNWIDTEKFSPSGSRALRTAYRERLLIPDRARVVVVVANCNLVKNHAFFFRMFARLPKDCIALHVGCENEEAFHERELVEKLGIADRVRFLGARDDVAGLLECTDVYVMCSLREGFSIAVLEALCKGIPTVVSDVPGLRDVAGRIPLCVLAALDEEKFASCVEHQLNLSESEKSLLRHASQEMINSNFSERKNVMEYVRLWRGEK